MEPMSLVTVILIIINVIVSYRGFKSESFFERYLFRVDNVLVGKEYRRLVSSGFLHIGWAHLVMNMISLYLFGKMLEAYMGGMAFLVVYMAGLIGGDLLALLIHRNHGDYSSVGASGAVSGVIFAAIALFPGMHVGFFLLPISIPGWLYGLIYVLYTIYGIRSKADNIGHEAHLGGALVGLLVALAFHPEAIMENYTTLLIIMVPACIFIYIIITRPHVLLIDNLFYKGHHRNANIEDRYNLEKRNQQQQIDDLLDKIHRKGMSSLTKAERDKLDEYSNNLSSG